MQQQLPDGTPTFPVASLTLSTIVTDVFFWFTAIGLTETLTGVGCVKKTGTSHSSTVLDGGPSTPFPIQISRILSIEGVSSSMP
jgi:hypothetical protein